VVESVHLPRFAGSNLVEEGGSGFGADLGEGWNGFGFRLACREAL